MSVSYSVKSCALAAALLGLAGCAPTVPDSGAPDPGAGVGFGTYSDYQQRSAARDAELSGGSLPPAQAVSSESLNDGGQSAPASGDLAAETQAVLDATRANSGVAPLEASPSNPPPAAVTNAAGISRENDFGAVGAQRSIEDDAARQAALRAQYQQVEVGAVPTRRGGSGPSIVDYALETSNPKGQGIYRRTGLNLQQKYTRNCAKYASPDQAQTEFLAKGGPQRDRLGLDPDGDGYACTWDPAPFRAARGAATAAGDAEIVEKIPAE